MTLLIAAAPVAHGKDWHVPDSLATLDEAFGALAAVLPLFAGGGVGKSGNLAANAAAVILLYGVSLGRADFFEAALLIALLGFVSTMALARFLLRGDIIE